MIEYIEYKYYEYIDDYLVKRNFERDYAFEKEVCDYPFYIYKCIRDGVVLVIEVPRDGCCRYVNWYMYIDGEDARYFRSVFDYEHFDALRRDLIYTCGVVRGMLMSAEYIAGIKEVKSND